MPLADPTLNPWAVGDVQLWINKDSETKSASSGSEWDNQTDLVIIICIPELNSKHHIPQT